MKIFRDKRIVFVCSLTTLSLALQAVYLLILSISYSDDAGAYYLSARFLAGLPGGQFLYQRPPGYPAFLVATGLTWLNNFDLLIAAQAIMGVLASLMMYAILRDVSRPAALAAAALFAVTGIPFTYAKAVMSEQPFMFFVLATLAACSHFITAKRPKYAVFAMAAAFATLMVRNEGLYVAVLAFVALLIAAWPARRLMATVALAGLVVAVLTLGWSVERSRFLERRPGPSPIGSLSNFAGHQLYAQIYVQIMWDDYNWRCLYFHSRTCKPALEPQRLVRPENGPATEHLAQLIRQWAKNSGYAPERFVSDYFDHPSMDQGPPDKLRLAWTEVIDRLGYVEGDRLLMRVCLEAIRARPEVPYVLAASSSPYFGISLQNLVAGMQGKAPLTHTFFSNWLEDYHENDPNAAVARVTLPPDLLRAYENDHGRPVGPLAGELLRSGRAIHNFVRNVVGPLFLLTLPAILLTRRRELGLALLLLGVLGLLLAVYAVAFGYELRAEHTVFPLMLMVTTISVHRLVGAFTRHRRRRAATELAKEHPSSARAMEPAAK